MVTTGNQIVGWDFYVADEAVITLETAFISDVSTRLQCGKNLTIPYHESVLAITSGAPDNVCIFSEDDRSFFGAQDLGTCFCDRPFSGASCDCPAITRGFGKATCGGWGSQGSMARTPMGTLAVARNAAPDDEAGCFQWTDADSVIRFGCKCRDVGKIFRTRMLESSAFDYPKIYLLKNTFDSEIFSNIETPVQGKSFIEAEVLAGGQQSVLASFVSADEVEAYLPHVLNRYPVFLEMEKLNETTDGSADIVWTARGTAFESCATAEACGVTLATTPCIGTNWTMIACDGQFLLLLTNAQRSISTICCTRQVSGPPP